LTPGGYQPRGIAQPRAGRADAAPNLTAARVGCVCCGRCGAADSFPQCGTPRRSCSTLPSGKEVRISAVELAGA